MNSLPKDVIRCFLSVCKAKPIVALTQSTTLLKNTITETKYQCKLRAHHRHIIVKYYTTDIIEDCCIGYGSYTPNNNRDGPQRVYEGELLTREVYYRDGKKHGYTRSYYGNTLEKFCYYESGRKEGLHQEWTIHESLYKRSFWLHGQEHGLSEIYDKHNGTLRWSCEYQHDKKHGTEKRIAPINDEWKWIISRYENGTVIVHEELTT